MPVRWEGGSKFGKRILGALVVMFGRLYLFARRFIASPVFDLVVRIIAARVAIAYIYLIA